MKILLEPIGSKFLLRWTREILSLIEGELRVEVFPSLENISTGIESHRLRFSYQSIFKYLKKSIKPPKIPPSHYSTPWLCEPEDAWRRYEEQRSVFSCYSNLTSARQKHSASAKVKYKSSPISTWKVKGFSFASLFLLVALTKTRKHFHGKSAFVIVTLDNTSHTHQRMRMWKGRMGGFYVLSFLQSCGFKNRPRDGVSFSDERIKSIQNALQPQRLRVSKFPCYKNSFKRGSECGDNSSRFSMFFPDAYKNELVKANHKPKV